MNAGARAMKCAIKQNTSASAKAFSSGPDLTDANISAVR